MPTEIPSPMTMQFEVEQVMDAEEAFVLSRSGGTKKKLHGYPVTRRKPTRPVS